MDFFKQWHRLQLLYPLPEFSMNFSTIIGIDLVEQLIRKHKVELNIKGALIAAIESSSHLLELISNIVIKF